MRILYESDAVDFSEDRIQKRNICNVFDIPVIQRELMHTYGVEVAASPKRKWSDNIWYIMLTCPYMGRNKDILNAPKGSEIALFVDYETESAFAMPRSGADKQTMMLISSVANKHIKDPFQCDTSLRSRLHSLGGDTK